MINFVRTGYCKSGVNRRKTQPGPGPIVQPSLLILNDTVRFFNTRTSYQVCCLFFSDEVGTETHTYIFHHQKHRKHEVVAVDEYKEQLLYLVRHVDVPYQALGEEASDPMQTPYDKLALSCIHYVNENSIMTAVR